MRGSVRGTEQYGLRRTRMTHHRVILAMMGMSMFVLCGQRLDLRLLFDT